MEIPAMRYEKGHKETTRQHVLDVAARQFRENGVAAAGLAGIMSEAGLTNGAFYGHFESKEELVREVLLNVLTRRKQRLRANLEARASLETILRDYLSERHRDHAGSGCPTAALVAEIARHPKTTRETFSEIVTSIIAMMAGRMPGTLQERQRKANAIYAMMVGALQLARAISDGRQSTDIMEDAIAAALQLSGETSGASKPAAKPPRKSRKKR
jgi:AcrR family transcriptional regulator